MLKENIKVIQTEDSFQWYENTHKQEKLINEAILKYYKNIDNSNQKEELKKKINNLDKQIIELIKQKVELKMEIDFVDSSDEIKNKNNEITNFINELKAENKLNNWYTYKDYRIYEVIKNGTYKLSIWYLDKPNKSWRTGKEQYEIGYTFSFIDALGGKVIKNLSKKINTKEEVFQYIEGRKKSYSIYFQEEKAPVIDKYRYNVEFYGVRLEGYKLESEIK